LKITTILAATLATAPAVASVAARMVVIFNVVRS
jgi:hypothetical protein